MDDVAQTGKLWVGVGGADRRGSEAAFGHRDVFHICWRVRAVGSGWNGVRQGGLSWRCKLVLGKAGSQCGLCLVSLPRHRRLMWVRTSKAAWEAQSWRREVGSDPMEFLRNIVFSEMRRSVTRCGFCCSMLTPWPLC